MQRAQDKIASMQARAGAIDELLESGALDDLTQPVDDIQKELDKVSSTNQVDNELAALKEELGTGSGGGDGAAALPAAEDAEVVPEGALSKDAKDASDAMDAKDVPDVTQAADVRGETVGGTGGESA
jgi:hypothetical protein